MLFGSWQHFDWHIASRGPSPTAKLLVSSASPFCPASRPNDWKVASKYAIRNIERLSGHFLVFNQCTSTTWPLTLRQIISPSREVMRIRLARILHAPFTPDTTRLLSLWVGSDGVNCALVYPTKCRTFKNVWAFLLCLKCATIAAYCCRKCLCLSVTNKELAYLR